MTPERWKQVEHLLDRALEQNPEAWPALLEEACGGDKALRRDVETLLRRRTEAAAFLQVPTKRREGLWDLRSEGKDFDKFDEASNIEDRRIGPYRLLRPLGRGGMGTVYLAERADGQYRQQVALKLLRWERSARPNEVRRFRAERQILAGLRHPNIAQLLDGGVASGDSPTGDRLYLVMEYVKGQSLGRYCDERCLPIRERLRLLLRICEAVQQAHSQRVVHRDLKPGNILVSSGGTVKLLDFGIAKILDEEKDPRITLPVTRTGMRLMTPEYAAPEQVSGGEIATTTDIYQLGVVLYELLTGQRPFELRHCRPSEIERILLEEEPEKPSSVLSRPAGGPRERPDETMLHDPAQVSRARGTQIASLRRVLRGDLDTIVLKALRKEPRRRYASAEDLAEDLKRYLGGLPVKAQKAAPGYRAKKFVRRHHRKVGVAVAFFILLTVNAALATHAITGAQRARRIAEERDRVRTEAQKAERVSAFLVDLFQASDALTGIRDGRLTVEKGLTVEEVLRRGARRLRTELKGQPAVQAELMTVIGRAYARRRRYSEAAPLLRSALRTRKRLLGASHPDVADTEGALARMLFRQGRLDAADSLYRHAAATLRERGGAVAPRRAPRLDEWARVLDARSSFSDSRGRLSKGNAH